PALPAMRFETVFLSVRWIVESLARSTMPSSTTLFSNSRSVQRARPFGGLEQASAISLASFSPSKMRATAGVARCLRLNTISNPSSTSSLTLIGAYAPIGEWNEDHLSRDQEYELCKRRPSPLSPPTTRHNAFL